MAALPVAATAQRTTDTAARSMWSALPISGIHFGVGSGYGPYLDRGFGGSRMGEFKLMLTLRKLPEWSVGVVEWSIQASDTTAFAVGEYHPPLQSVTSGVLVERRWHREQPIHRIMSVAAGVVDNYYESSYMDPFTGETGYDTYDSRSSLFMQLSGGGEVNLGKWTRVMALIGYRAGGRMTIPGANGSNGGFTLVTSVAFGKF
jgi:hypothetical protein